MKTQRNRGKGYYYRHICVTIAVHYTRLLDPEQIKTALYTNVVFATTRRNY